MNTKLILALSSFLFFTRTIAIDFLVDPLTENPSFYEVYSLRTAISNMMNLNYLYFEDVRIFLSPSCIGTVQSMGNREVMGLGSLTIQYTGTYPPISQESDCFLLPQLVLEPGDQLSILFLSSFTLQGVNLQYGGDPSSISLVYYVENVVFSNVCFNNSEPSHTLPSSYTGKNFYVWGPTLCSITNMIFFNDGYKQLGLVNVQNLIINELAVVQLPWATQTVSSPIFIIHQESPNSFLSISSLTITCDSTSNLAPNLLFIRDFGTAYISNVRITGCDLQHSPLMEPSFFRVWCGTFLSINGLSASNLQYGNLTLADLFGLKKIGTVEVSNVNISDVTLNPVLFQISDICDCIFRTSSVMKITLTNWQVSNSQFVARSKMINMIFSDYRNFAETSFSSLTMKDTTLNGTAILISIAQTAWDTLTENLLTVTIHDCSFTRNNLDGIFSSFITLVFSKEIVVFPGDAFRSVETVHMSISNFVFTENTLSNQASVFKVDGVAASVRNLSAENNTLTNSKFFEGQRVSSVFLKDSIVKNLNLHQQAAFFETYFINIPSDLNFEPSFANQNDGIFAYTRPAIFYSCNFQDIHLDSGSTFIKLGNTMIIYQQNSLVGAVLDGSSFINTGYFPNFLSYSIIFYNITTVSLNTSLVYPFLAAESYLFQENSELFSIYNTAKNNAYSENQENMVYFIAIQDNLFSSIEASNQANILQVSDFQAPNSSIILSDNIFTNISSNDSVQLIRASYLPICFFVNQQISEVNASGYFVSYVASKLNYLLLQDNVITNTQKLGFYDIEANECSQLIIQNNEASALQTQKRFIKIVCKLLNGQIYFKDSKFNGIIESSSPQLVEILRFISLEIEKSSIGALSAFENNSFSSITIHQEGICKGRYQARSFLFFHPSPRSSLKALHLI